MAEWGWRVPFMLGAALGFIVVYLRRALPETLTEEEKAETTPPAHVWSGVRKHWLGLLAIIFVVGAAQAYNYAWNVGLPSLARGGFGEDPTAVFAITTVLGVVLLVGSLDHRRGRGRQVNLSRCVPRSPGSWPSRRCS